MIGDSTRRTFVALAQAVLAAGATEAIAQEPEPPPNVLLVLVDDLGRQDLGCYGNGVIDTPVMDRLAEEGMRFTQAYSACPVCSPTRAALLTGKSTARVHFTGHITATGEHRHPANSAIIPPNDLMDLPLNEITIAEALQPAGYVSASIGKWHVGHEGFYPTDQGFDLNVAGWTHGSPASYWDPYTSDKEWNPSIPTLAPRHEGEYLTDRLTDEAIAFIRKNSDRPFFCYLPHYAVHTPLQAPDELVAKYKNRGRPEIDPVYAAMVERVDQGLRRILATLDELDVAKNTVVILASDNGGLASVTDNRPFRAGKGHLYEGGVRVPLIVRWPGNIPSRSVNETPTTSEDLFATVVALAGVAPDPNQTLDGRSLLPELLGNGEVQERDLHWYYPHYSPQAKAPGAAIRSGRWKLIEFYDPPRIELYDLEADIGETNNLADNQPAVANDLRDRLNTWLDESDTIMHTPNPNAN